MPDPQVWSLDWQLTPVRTEQDWHCPACRRAVWLRPAQPAKGDLTACEACLAPLRVGVGCFHKVKDSGMTRLIYEYPLIACELLKLIEQYNQKRMNGGQ